MSKWGQRFLDLAEHVGEWSHDPRTQVGAVIVDDHKRVVSMGYNGFPRGVAVRKNVTMIALLNIYSYAMLREMHSTMLLSALKDAQCMYRYFLVTSVPSQLYNMVLRK